jgi:hypothetical protein
VRDVPPRGIIQIDSGQVPEQGARGKESRWCQLFEPHRILDPK